jgi:excisionase family DNA binding protein
VDFSLNISQEIIDEIARRAADIVDQRQRRASTSGYLTTDQAAEYIGTRTRRIYELVQQGKLPVYKDGSRSLYKREDLDACLELNR